MKNRYRGLSPNRLTTRGIGRGIQSSRGSWSYCRGGINRHWGTYISKQNAGMLARNNSFKLKDCGVAPLRLKPLLPSRLLTEIPDIEQAGVVAAGDSLVIWRNQVIDRQHRRPQRSCLVLKSALEDFRKIAFLRATRFADDV
jgi:hypothetical protein